MANLEIGVIITVSAALFVFFITRWVKHKARMREIIKRLEES